MAGSSTLLSSALLQETDREPPAATRLADELHRWAGCPHSSPLPRPWRRIITSAEGRAEMPSLELCSFVCLFHVSLPDGEMYVVITLRRI